MFSKNLHGQDIPNIQISIWTICMYNVCGCGARNADPCELSIADRVVSTKYSYIPFLPFARPSSYRGPTGGAGLTIELPVVNALTLAGELVDMMHRLLMHLMASAGSLATCDCGNSDSWLNFLVQPRALLIRHGFTEIVIRSSVCLARQKGGLRRRRARRCLNVVVRRVERMRENLALIHWVILRTLLLVLVKRVVKHLFLGFISVVIQGSPSQRSLLVQL